MKDNKTNIILLIVIVVLLMVIVFLLIRNKDDNTAKNNEVNYAEKFAEEYTQVDEDNVFVYADIEEIIDILENGSGVVYLGFPECKWCQAYVKFLNEVAKDRNIDKIYYYNIREDRTNNSENYQKIVKLLEGYLQNDEDGNPRIYVPAIIFMSNGKIIGFDDETSLDTGGYSEPSDYWTEEEVSDLKDKLNKIIDNSGICTDCSS